MTLTTTLPTSLDELKDIKDYSYSQGYQTGTKYGRRLERENAASTQTTIKPGVSKAFNVALKTLLAMDNDGLGLLDTEIDNLCHHAAFALTLAQSMEN